AALPIYSGSVGSSVGSSLGSSDGSSLGTSVGPGEGSSVGFVGTSGDTVAAGPLPVAGPSDSSQPVSEHSGDEWAAVTDGAPRVEVTMRAAAARSDAVRRLGALMQCPLRLPVSTLLSARRPVPERERHRTLDRAVPSRRPRGSP